MANDPNPVKIKIETEADTAALEATKENLEQISESAKNVGEKTAEAEDPMKTLVNLERAEIAVKIGEGIGKIGEAVKKLSADFKETDREFSKTLENVSTGLDSLSNGLSLAAQGFAVGGPFGAAIGGLIGLMTGPLHDAFGDMMESIQGAKIAEKEAEEATKKLATTRQSFADQVRKEKGERFFQDELTTINQEVAAVERLMRVRASARELDAAKQSAAGAAAIAGGASPTAVKAGEVGSSLNNELAAITDKLAAAAERTRALSEQASLAETSLNNATAAQDRDAAGLKVLADKAQSAREAADSAKLDLDSLREISTNQMSAAISKSKEEIGSVGKEGMDELTAQAEKTRAALTAMGSSLDASGKEGLAGLNKILADHIITADEIRQTADALNQVKNSRAVLDDSVRSGFEATVKAQDAVLKILPQIVSRISQQAKDIEDLNAKILQGR